VWNLSAIQCSSRCLDLGEWALLFAHARFSRFAPDAPSPQALVYEAPEPRILLPAWRRLSAPWMLTLRTPSFADGAGRAFTENDLTSDAPCRSAAPVCRLLFRPPASASRAFLAREVGFTARARIVPPSPRLRGAISP